MIEGAACEPEVSDLAEFLVACGARIEGIGSHRLVVDGVWQQDAQNPEQVPNELGGLNSLLRV